MKKVGRKIAGGDNQINLGLSDDQVEILLKYIRIKGLRTLQDGLRLMIDGARDFVTRTGAGPSSSPTIGPEAAQKASSSAAAPADDQQDPVVSDDGMRLPPVVIDPPVQPELDEDGEELSESEKMRRSRAKPAMDVESTRWASLRDEV